MSSRKSVYVGIDPGKGGGLVGLYRNGAVAFSAGMPQTEVKLFHYLQRVVARYNVAHVIIERITGYVGGGGGRKGKKARQKKGIKLEQGPPGSSMFTMAGYYWGPRMALVALGLYEGERFSAVMASVWQKFLGIEKKGDATTSQFKNRLKDKALELFPHENVTLKTADAYLIATYCLLNHRLRA